MTRPAATFAWFAAADAAVSLATAACSAGDEVGGNAERGNAAAATLAPAVDPTLRVPAPLQVGNLAAGRRDVPSGALVVAGVFAVIGTIGFVAFH